MFGRRILTPSLHRDASYDSAIPASRDYAFTCVRCAAVVRLDLVQIGEAQPGDETLLGRELAPAVREHFDFNLVGKSHDGGGPRLALERCVRCGTEYLVYVGVREPTNGHVLITVHGITEWTAQPT